MSNQDSKQFLRAVLHDLYYPSAPEPTWQRVFARRMNSALLSELGTTDEQESRQ